MSERCKDCYNVPIGETCICIGCKNQRLDSDNCCMYEPCVEFNDMQRRSLKQKEDIISGKPIQESIDELNKVFYKEVFTPILDVVTAVLTWIMNLLHIKRSSLYPPPP